MKRNVLTIRVAAFCCIWMILSLIEVHAACRNPNIAEGNEPLFRRAAASWSVGDNAPFIVPAAASGFIEITWFGHAFFQLTSSSGTRIVTDPFSEYIGYPVPEVWPHVVTVGKETRNHSNVGLPKGDPLILRGLESWGLEWNEINTTLRDVLIYNVPIHMRTWYEFRKGSAFVFEMDGLCICHTGDAGEPFNQDQLDLIGHIDILFVPIGGSYTMGPESAKKVVEQLKPKIAVPMHYYNNTFLLQRFLDGPYQARFLETNTFSVSKDTLPPATEIFIPKVIWYGRDEDF
jgi:L-ascorbate metabolism protein UlaG (beta-lactamase superfamily)